jgi:hypothetical protein
MSITLEIIKQNRIVLYLRRLMSVISRSRYPRHSEVGKCPRWHVYHAGGVGGRG